MKGNLKKGLVLIFIILENTTIFFPLIPAYSFQKTLESVKSDNSQNKYVILKLDDYGEGYWDEIISLFINKTNYIGDFGVIAKKLQDDFIYVPLLRQLLNTNRSEVFNHGWDHICPEFFNRTYPYQFDHIRKWNALISSYFNVSSFILCPPCNSWDNTTYRVMNDTGYKIMFLSKEFGLNIPIIYLDKLSLSELDDQLNMYYNNQILLINLHPAINLYWKNIIQIQQYLDQIYSTGRKGITMSNYYNQIYLKNTSNSNSESIENYVNNYHIALLSVKNVATVTNFFIIDVLISITFLKFRKRKFL